MVLSVLPDKGVPLRAEQADELWTRAGPTMIGIVVMVTVLIFIGHEFSGIVAPLLLGAWLAFMGGAVLFLIATLAVFTVPRWRQARSARFWMHCISIVTVSFAGGIASSVWILLPPANDALRMLSIFLYVWFVAMVMMASATPLSAAGCLALIASLLAFVLTHPMPYAGPLAVFLLMVAAALLTMRRQIWRVADEAAAARAISVRAAESLERALAIVRAERDAKTRFIAAASHDLQQPIQAASLFLDTALDARDAAVRDQAASGARRALRSTQALIEAMLDHLRLEAGAIAPQPIDVALDDVIAAVALDHAPAAGSAGIAIATVDSRIVATADPRLLQRALGNLVANAVRHSGGTRVLIGARLIGGAARLWVIDDGRGVAEADVERLFEDFVQGSDHGADNRGGFGLGLSSARHLAQLQGGALDLDRRWRGGSAFVISLQVARRTETPVTALEARRSAA